VLGIYAVGGWIAFQVSQTLTEGLGLPDWLPPLAIVLFIILLPVVLATSFVQEGVRESRRRETLPPFGAGPGAGEALPEAVESEAAEPAVRETRGAHHRVFTWRNAGLGVVIALGVWGVMATLPAADVQPTTPRWLATWESLVVASDLNTQIPAARQEVRYATESRRR
jgi:hypothetical protein